MSRTLILVKPDAFARNLTGEIIARFERKGLRIAQLQLTTLDRVLAEQHYAEHEGKPFFEELVAFITSGPLVAMVLVPSLYAGLYLYANKDPYAHLDGLPAAVVVQDRGTTLADGQRLQVGDEVASTLVKAHDLDWHEVDATKAADGLREGDYAFVLVVPETFSADLASSADFTVQRPVPFCSASSRIRSTSGSPVLASVWRSTSAVISMR